MNLATISRNWVAWLYPAARPSSFSQVAHGRHVTVLLRSDPTARGWDPLGAEHDGIRWN
jgi:hypothetical protein